MEKQVTNVQCPTCCMTARSSDHRHLRPVAVDNERNVDVRQCRNCGEIFSLGEREVSV